jgi:hypothetical protein
MKYTITECSTKETFDTLEVGDLFVRVKAEETLYLKGRNEEGEEFYINLKTGKIIPAVVFKVNELTPDYVFPITSYDFEAYLQREV